MHFSNKNNPDLPASFSLSVKKARAVLLLAAKKLVMENSIGTFNATTRSAAQRLVHLDRTGKRYV